MGYVSSPDTNAGHLLENAVYLALPRPTSRPSDKRTRITYCEDRYDLACLPALIVYVELNGMNKFQGVLGAFYEDWRRGRADEKSVSDFSRWVGIAPAVMHNYMKGRRKPEPGSKELKALEAKLGGAIYDALDLPRPAIRAAMSVLSELPDQDQTATIASIIFRARSSELSPKKKADIKEMEDYLRQKKKGKQQKHPSLGKGRL